MSRSPNREAIDRIGIGINPLADFSAGPDSITLGYPKAVDCDA